MMKRREIPIRGYLTLSLIEHRGRWSVKQGSGKSYTTALRGITKVVVANCRTIVGWALE